MVHKEEVISTAEWLVRRERHRREILPITEPFRARRTAGKADPVYDFLFTYYNFSTMKLERWHPGAGVQIRIDREAADPEALAELAQSPSYHFDGEHLSLNLNAIKPHVREQLGAVRALCKAVRSRPPRFACFGLHEWAMVYRAEAVRHPYPLRLSDTELAEFVESQTVCCSHFDAFRFFTPSATRLNVIQPRPDTRLELEQGGCIHANMDLYKWAYKLSPVIGSDLLRECFELARLAREVDMRASPYDLSSRGIVPIAIETPAGRELYVAEQQQIATEGNRVRSLLLDEIDRIENLLLLSPEQITGTFPQ